MRIQILVVDDEPSIGELIVFALSTEGYGAHYALNGEAALRRLSVSPAALVLTDYMMPIMNGCELATAMRARKALATTPILMVSALAEVMVRETCPVDGYIRKPFGIRQLLDAVRNLLGNPHPPCPAGQQPSV